jgi:hypothetical protein
MKILQRNQSDLTGGKVFKIIIKNGDLRGYTNVKYHKKKFSDILLGSIL